MIQLTHKPDWFPSTPLLNQARNELPWEAKEVTVFGRRVLQPRLVSLVVVGYAYSGSHLLTTPIPAWLQLILSAVSSEAGTDFNSILFNRYRNGQDSIGWHSDDEKMLGPDPVVASLSLGAPRRFCTRPIGGTPSSITLSHGDLLVMPQGFQARFQHSMPKTAAIVGERISLTFRKILG